MNGLWDFLKSIWIIWTENWLGIPIVVVIIIVIIIWLIASAIKRR